MNIAELSFAVKDFLGPFSRLCKAAGKRAKKLDDLGDVVVVFAVFCAGLRVEEVVACYEFEDQWGVSVVIM